MTTVTARALQEVTGRNARKDKSSSEPEKQTERVRTRHAEADCSKYGKQQPEKLGHRQSTAEYGEQAEMKMRRNADVCEPRHPTLSEARRRGTTVLSHADICRQEQHNMGLGLRGNG